MSKRLFLCGHTGSQNRGCEAIVRSTIKVFKEAGLCFEPFLATGAPAQDEAAGISKLAKLIPYGVYKSSLQRVFCAVKRKLFSNPLAGQNIIQKKLWESIETDDLSLSIGGDTYCYKVPTVFIAHNKRMLKNSTASVLWCCSVGKENLSKPIVEDLKNYTLIVAREEYTQQNLIEAGVAEEKIIRCCDPAFMLDIKKCELPEGFVQGNTVGINISSLVKNDKVYASVEYMIEKIIGDTQMNICFIPHVYDIAPESGDLELLRVLYNKYQSSGRVSIVDKAYSCEELKYIISKCRFFVGARTHSTIAAYSTMVPTLVLGYSIKSLGIAKDLFSTEKGYVIPYTEIEEKDHIYNVFCEICNNEEAIKQRYEEILPEYKNTVIEAAKMIYKKYLGE